MHLNTNIENFFIIVLQIWITTDVQMIKLFK